MANRIALNSINNNIFNVRANETADKTQDRADIVGLGRTLFYEHARKGQSAIFSALKANDSGLADSVLQAGEYGKVNEIFRNDHLLYAARKVCEFTGEKAPENFEQFKQMSGKFYGNQHFYAVLQGIYQEIITPILPAVYSEAVAQFADVVYRIVAGSVQFMYVQRPLLVESPAALAYPAGISVALRGAVDGLGKDACTCGLAHSPRSAEEVGVGQLARLDGILQRSRQGQLPNHGVEVERPVFPGRNYIFIHRHNLF